MFNSYRCPFCLKASNKYKGRFLPNGFVCSPTCESDYIDKFILPFNHSEHRCRAKWIQHLGLRSMNNFGRLPTCKDHFSFRICLLDTINLETIRNWVTSPENSEKARKKRSRRRFVPKTSQDLIINYIYNLSGGTICAGLNCFQSLWLFTGAFGIRHQNWPPILQPHLPQLPQQPHGQPSPGQDLHHHPMSPRKICPLGSQPIQKSYSIWSIIIQTTLWSNKEPCPTQRTKHQTR